MGAHFYEPAALTAELWARNTRIIAYLCTLGKRKKAVLTFSNGKGDVTSRPHLPFHQFLEITTVVLFLGIGNKDHATWAAEADGNRSDKAGGWIKHANGTANA